MIEYDTAKHTIVLGDLPETSRVARTRGTRKSRLGEAPARFLQSRQATPCARACPAVQSPCVSCLSVSVPEVSGFEDPAPMFQVFMLKDELSGEPTEASFVDLRLPMSRPVVVGLNRHVSIDVTEYVKKILLTPTANHGLVIGSVTGERRATIVPRSNAFGAGVVAQLVFIE